MKRFSSLWPFIVLMGGFGLYMNVFGGEQLIGARTPALSPDGKFIAFSYLGDIWVASVEGGQARRITDHNAYDGKPIWAPDGKWLAFTSNRMGNEDVFLIPASGGEVRQLTFHTGNDEAMDFTPDGRWVVFRSNRSSISSLFKISVSGGNPLPLLDTYWSWPFSAKIHPDGRTMLFSLGIENNYWWRRGYRGSNSAKIWQLNLKNNEARLVVSHPGNSLWPAWSPDGDTIYFVSERDLDTKNIWKISISGGPSRPVTRFREWDITFLSVARKVPLAVCERNFAIWLTDLSTGSSHPIVLAVPAELKTQAYSWVENGRVSEYRLSPDGEKIAAVVRGEIFVLASEGGYARNITQTPWRERQVIWDKDSRHLIYVSDRDGNPELYRASALGEDEPLRLTHSPEDELKPELSPDGKWMAYYRGKRQLRLMHPDGNGDHLVLEADFGGWRAGRLRWSPDSRYLAVEVYQNGNLDILALEVKSKKTYPLTNTAYDETRPYWSQNGKFLLFSSNRFGHSFPEFTGKWDLYQVFLQPKQPTFDEDRFEKLFQEEKKKKDSKNPPIRIQLQLKDLDNQTRRIINTNSDEQEFLLSAKDTATIYFVSDIDGKNHLWKTSLKEKEFGTYEPFMARIDGLRNLQQDSKGKFLYYLRKGHIGRILVSNRKNETISFQSKIRVEKTADYEQMLAELYYTLQYYYYDKQHHHVDWKKIYQRFRPVLQQVREDHDFYDYANQMIGYLNSSHTGIRGPRSEKVETPSAHFGVLWDFSPETVRIKKILPHGPLYLHRDSLTAGDVLLSINGKTVDAKKNFYRYVNGLLKKRVQLRFQHSPGGRTITVAVKPISARAENNLLLEEWIRSRKEWVKKKTGDRIAYIYMRAMGRNDLERFLKELERDAVPRKGLILDLRYNFGGNVHDRVLQALTRPVYAKWQRRGLAATQQSTFGFADKPVVMLTNEVTLSDGEMTANGFKTLHRGLIVGNTTYGWLIFTTSIPLLNGGSFRLPFWGCYTLDGQDLETIGGITPDIEIINDLSHELNGQDPQLDRAIEVILAQMK